MELLTAIANVSFYGTSEEKFIAGIFVAICAALVFVPIFTFLSWLDAREARNRYGFRPAKRRRARRN